MIPLMRSALLQEHETLDALAAWLQSHPLQLSMGPQCLEFERKFAHWQVREYAVLFNSGSSANLALLQALINLGKLERSDWIGFSALTWATNVMPIIQLGMRPFAIDVDPAMLNITTANLSVLKQYQSSLNIGKGKLSALFLTTALGMTGDLPAIRQCCADHSILLLEDNCESLGTTVKDATQLSGMQRAGNYGLASTFSFFVAHHMSTIEGGMVCTDDPDLAEMLIMVRANGWDRDLKASQQAKWRNRYAIADEFQAKYTFYVSGYNLRPTEITGFLGQRQLNLLGNNIYVREQIFYELEQVALQNADFQPLAHDHLQRLSPFAFPIVCRTPELRHKYLLRFAGAGVEVRPLIAGDITQQPFYGQYWPTDTPNARMLSECGLYFGIYPDLTAADIEILKSCLGGW